jgi:hypothetical protein
MWPNQPGPSGTAHRTDESLIAIRFGGDPRQILATLLLIGLMTLFAVGILVPRIQQAALSRSLRFLSPTCLSAHAGLIPSGHDTGVVQAIWLRSAPGVRVAAIDRAIAAAGLPRPSLAFSLLGGPGIRSTAMTLGADRVLLLPLATQQERLAAAKADYFRTVPGVEAVDIDYQGLHTDPILLLCGANGHTLVPADELLVTRARSALLAMGVAYAAVSASVPAIVTHTHLLNGTYTMVVFGPAEKPSSVSQQGRSLRYYTVCFSSSDRLLFAAKLNWA